MNEGQIRFQSGASRAEQAAGQMMSGQGQQENGQRQIWNADSYGNPDAVGAVGMTERFATGGESAKAGEYQQRAEQAAKVAEMQEKGVFGEGTKFYDVKNDGLESDTEKQEVIDALRENGVEASEAVGVVEATDGRKANPGEECVRIVEEAFGKYSGDPNTQMKILQEQRKTYLLKQFGRVFPYNGEAAT